MKYWIGLVGALLFADLCHYLFRYQSMMEGMK